MSWQNIWQLVKSDYVKLVLILALAFYIAFIPKIAYPYPVHLDEWEHMARSKAIMQAGDITFIDAFYGQAMTTFAPKLEAGFHLFWGAFQTISGISWLDIFRYFPGIIFIITVLSVFILARREGFGWEAALFTCLIPTTVGILGPAFLVPAAMGLLFTPLMLFLAFNFRTWWCYLLIFISTCFLLCLHAPSAICPIIVLFPYILLNLKGNLRHSLGMALALLLPFLVVLPLIFEPLLTTAKSLLTPQLPQEFVQLPRLIQTYGYLPVVLCLVGTFVLGVRGGKKGYGLILGLLALLLMLVTFFTFHYGVPLMYVRGMMYMMLMASIVAGAGLMGVKNLRLPARFSDWLKVPLITQNVGVFLCLILIGVTLVVSIPDRLDIPYYHIIDEEDYQAFVWIGDNVNEDYGKAILDPWKATAFTAITGKYVYTRIEASPTAKDKKTKDFLESGCIDTAFLKENGISIVYNRKPCSNPDLVEVRKNVYLLKERE